MSSAAQRISIDVEDGQRVSALLQTPQEARACYVLAHGAGAGMTHPFITAIAEGLEQRRIATLRYQFPYMERGAKRPDGPRITHAAVRAAVEEAARSTPGLPLVAGGKSFGGRMTSEAQAISPLPGVRGIAFLGFPLHAPGRPSDSRAAHLVDVSVPLLFLQGGEDKLADPALLADLVRRLGAHATLELFPNADHSFHVPKRSGRTDEEIKTQLLDALAAWIERVVR